MKEKYFDEFVAHRDLVDSPGRGRKILGEEASRRIPAIRDKCPEDFDDMAKRLENKL